MAPVGFGAIQEVVQQSMYFFNLNAIIILQATLLKVRLEVFALFLRLLAVIHASEREFLSIHGIMNKLLMIHAADTRTQPILAEGYH